ncbi:hypothetical protein V5O48_012163 [Marasmius crinis-equi]|uniref:Uncharacterized protein n=1 Tax=Marasmius crinis-equi TaxID=585013 RepID=A0ABR3F3W8_9AGAR
MFRTNRELLAQKVEEHEDVLLNLDSPDYKRAEASLKLPEVRMRLKDFKKRLQSKELLLGVAEDQRVQHLLNSPFLKFRMNALALKTRLIARLRAQKFERDRLECSFRKQLNDQKIHSQIPHSLKRQEPSIQTLARDYNSLVTKMEDLVRCRQAPTNAVVPEKIPMDQLFTLDVNSTIWQDVGLTDKYDKTEPPAWLADDSVCTGIQALLERDWSLEEIKQLSHERNAIQEAIDKTVHPAVAFQLHQQRSDMLELCWHWQTSAGTIGKFHSTSEWGPSDDEVQEAGLGLYAESLPTETMNGYDSEESEGLDITDYDEDEFNVIESFDMLDSYTPSKT